MKVLIVEDDLVQAKNIVNHIYDVFGKQVQILGPNAYYKEAIGHVKKETFDMAILDIQLQDDRYAGVHIGETIELLHNIPILYVSGISDDKIIEQTRTIQNCNYISKPFDSEAIKRALLKIKDQVNFKELETFKDKISYKPRHRDTYWIKEGTSNYTGITIKDIVFVEAKDKICEFNMINGDILKKRATLEKQIFDETLRYYPNFYKLSRSYIVNLDHINNIDGRRIVYPELNKKIYIKIPEDQLKTLFKLIGLHN